MAVMGHAMEQDPAITTRTSLLVLSGWVALSRGDLATARARLDRAREIMKLKLKWLKTQDYFSALWLEASIALEGGDPAAALDAARPVLDHGGLPDDARYAWPVLVTAVTACDQVGEEAAGDLRRIRERVAGLETSGPLQRAYRLTYDAKLAKANGLPDRAAWEKAAAAWEGLGNPYYHARALCRAAESALAGGDHDGAAAMLRTAVEITDRLGAVPLGEEAAGLLRRTRAPRTGSAPLGLTPREFEVLRLVAEGRSNRDIAEALFISVKTASVHVSNILGKLEVTSRGEAAATAHRLGLFAAAKARA
ncbi:response regulator transcription factor [Actinomadura madurae]